MGLGALAALSVGHVAQAAQSAVGIEAVGVGEVVVTARHRTESAQSVPTALNVFDGDFLQKRNLNSLSDISQLTPSVQFTATNPRNSNINVRGFGANVGLANDGLVAGVGFYIDQVFYSRPAAISFQLADVDRVEVLRGPQGTLFGKDTTAGAINITTASPTFTPSGSLELTGGNYGYFQVKATASGPIIADKVAGRIAITSDTRGGVLTNVYDGDKVNDLRDLTVRGQLLYTPSDNLRVRFIADYGDQREHCCAAMLADIVSPTNGKNFRTLAAQFGYTPVVNPSARQVNENSPFQTWEEHGGASAQIDYTLSNVVLTSVTAWRFWNWRPTNDADFSPVTVFGNAGVSDYERQFSQEFRVASRGDNRLDYVAGVYLFHESMLAKSASIYGNAAAAFLLGATLPSIVADGVTSTSRSKYDTNSLAAFGQATWHVTQDLKLTGGLRYTHDAKRGATGIIAGGGVPLTGALAALAPLRAALASNGGFEVKDRTGKVSAMVNLSYNLAPRILVYANYAKGYKSGGLNLTPLPVGATPIVKPESIDSVELGAKTSFFERRLQLNSALFWQRGENYQANNYDTTVGRTYLSNVPAIRAEGVEVDAQAQPTENLSLYASATFNDAIYADYPHAPCGLEAITQPSCDLSGRPLAGTPRWAAAVGGEYSHDVALSAHQARAFVGLDYSYRSSLYAVATDTAASRLPQLSLVNGRLGVRTDRWSAYLWAKNLMNEGYYSLISIGLGNTGAIYGLPGDPRTFGGTIRVSY